MPIFSISILTVSPDLRNLLGFHGKAYACWGSSRYDVVWFKGHHSAQVMYCLADVENHVLRGGVLAKLVVDPRADRQV